MYIEGIKKELEQKKGKNIKIKYNLGRNKFEYYDACIAATYKHIFLVKLNNREEIKTFTYTDVLTKAIQIDLH